MKQLEPLSPMKLPSLVRRAEIKRPLHSFTCCRRSLPSHRQHLRTPLASALRTQKAMNCMMAGTRHDKTGDVLDSVKKGTVHEAGALSDSGKPAIQAGATGLNSCNGPASSKTPPAGAHSMPLLRHAGARLFAATPDGKTGRQSASPVSCSHGHLRA